MNQNQKSYPTNFEPSFVLRSRREVNTIDSINSRFVNYWQNDNQLDIPEPKGSGLISTFRLRQLNVMDMNPTPSRLYRENIQQSQPYVVPSESSDDAQRTKLITTKIRASLSTIQALSQKEKTPAVKAELAQENDLYNILLTQEKNLQIDAMGANPYFDKYDVAGDSRNIVRELRGVVSEGVVDRGIMESQKLLQREMESRWIASSSDHSVEKGLNPVEAFELLRPRFNNMANRYN